MEFFQKQKPKNEDIPIHDESLISEAKSIQNELTQKYENSFRGKVFSGLRKIAFLSSLYVVLNFGAEGVKRVYLDQKYKALQEKLDEIKSDILEKEIQEKKNYEEKLNEAKNLFGEDNIGFLHTDYQDTKKEKIHYFEEYTKDVRGEIYDFSNFMSRVVNIPLNNLFFSAEDGKSKDFDIRMEEWFENDLKDIISPEKITHRNAEDQDSENNTNIINKDGAQIIFQKEPLRTNIEDTLENKTLEKIIEDTYPKGWFNEEVYRIVLDKERIFTKGEDHLAVYGQQFEEGGHFSRSKHEIVLANSDESFKNSSYWFFDVISHESGHANDWESNNDLTNEERLDFLLKIYDRIKSNDRFMSSYVEEINPKDLKQKNYTQCTEYWAEICGEYFTNGKNNLSPKDITIIESIIKKKQDNFSIDRALLERKSIVENEVYDGEIYKQIDSVENEINLIQEQDYKYQDTTNENYYFVGEVTSKLESFQNANKEELRNIKNQKNMDDYDLYSELEKVGYENIENSTLKTWFTLKKQAIEKNKTYRELQEKFKKLAKVDHNYWK